MKALKRTSTREMLEFLDYDRRWTPRGYEYMSDRERKDWAEHYKKVGRFKRELKRRGKLI
jgi:hypothetical protein